MKPKKGENCNTLKAMRRAGVKGKMIRHLENDTPSGKF